ncbi:hypothetical protein GQ55_1G360000 [Panicum hallii var. hallii]|uniref:Reverse transcriptase zinc-binding domain-containing protein n=1 Tax=Panicum hallii var. hallii TaxID=1504633 RepID=A0A2T7FB53_9POAL|nr:hypothetical protein GQ55_1G360000 [Panicum hallii var. hallii]
MCSQDWTASEHLFIRCSFTRQLWVNILAAFEVWKERNARIFRAACLQQEQLLLKIKAEAEAWVTAGAVVLGCLEGE